MFFLAQLVALSGNGLIQNDSRTFFVLQLQVITTLDSLESSFCYCMQCPKVDSGASLLTTTPKKRRGNSLPTHLTPVPITRWLAILDLGTRLEMETLHHISRAIWSALRSYDEVASHLYPGLSEHMWSFVEEVPIRQLLIARRKFFDGGSISKGQGSRSDLQEIKELIALGATEEKLAAEHFSQWVYHRKAFAAYRSLLQIKRSWVTKVYVLVGKPGTGKSRVCHSASDDLWVATDCTGRWFDGYQGQKDVLFDDFDGTDAQLGTFLKLCDRYAMDVPVKGGFVNWKPERIFFTSNVQVETWWAGASSDQFGAFKRRVTKLIIQDDTLIFDDHGKIPDYFE